MRHTNKVRSVIVMSNGTAWAKGDRVRVIQPQSPYTGCRGTLVEAPGSKGNDAQLPLGYYVAIDGENGIAQPFLTEALERIAAVSSRPRATSDQVVER